MERERSQQNAGTEMTSNDRPTKAGVLYIVAVPIGHFDDITVRAIQILGEADLIASENPAATQRLLSHHGIAATLTSYGPTNLKEKVAVLTDRLLRGACIALVSDCGSPIIADPGHLLVASAHSHGIRVTSVPGPSAITAAAAAAGLPCDSFFFQGRLPETRFRMRRCLAIRLKSKSPTVAFCPPASLALALKTMADIAPRRILVLACDVTKADELIIRGTVRQIQRRLNGVQTIRDITLILAGKGSGGVG